MMEKLKSVVADNLKQMVAESTTDDLLSTSTSLLHFFRQLPLFQNVVRELADPEMALSGKNKDRALELKQMGNCSFSGGDYPKALSYYSEALRVCPVDADDMDKNLVATLHVNRASVLHKMGLLMECLRDCNRAIQISSNYAKAWYRRGKVNGSLGNYKEAVLDLNVALKVELSLVGKRQIETELKMLQNKMTNCSVLQENGNKLSCADELHQNKVQCVSMKDKGRGMASVSNICESSLVHAEEPFAVVILKHCRDTHCHYCFNELPADTIPCESCSIPLYCSQHCQSQAGGHIHRNHLTSHAIHTNLSSDLENHIAKVTLCSTSGADVQNNIPEHKHECQGVHWPAILPSEVILAGRIIMKSRVQSRTARNVSYLLETLELFHCYAQMPPERKLETHIYSIVLLYCLRHSYNFYLPIDEVSISQVVVLMSQIRVNSMAIVRMESTNSSDILDGGSALTNKVEQVRVGQAIYRAGSLFNHSCQPNVHAYFIARTLYIRTTEPVARGCPLELSYGPQVGQYSRNDRLEYLLGAYSFKCQCSGCSEVNLSDLVLNSYACVNPDCFGTVLDSSAVYDDNQKTKLLTGSPKARRLEPHLQVDKLIGDEVNRIDPGYCLKCGSYRDLESSRATAERAWIYIRRLKDAIVSEDLITATLQDALRSLSLLRSTLHAYNKGIAEAEDLVGHACCLLGELQPAVDHCKTSTKILEKLYGPKHIVIGYELLKFASIQLYMGDPTAVDSINRLIEIFSRHYGLHVDIIFPHLKSLVRVSRVAT